MNIKNTCQQYFSQQINPNKKFLKRPTVLLRALSTGERKILSIFKNMGNYKNLYFKQSWLAEASGLSRGRVNTIIKKLTDYGLIAKRYRHMNTSTYKVSSFLTNPTPLIKKILMLICPIYMGLLISRPFYPPFGHQNKHRAFISDMQSLPENGITHTNNKTIKNSTNNSNSYINNYINPSIINGRYNAKSILYDKKEDFIPEIIKTSLKFLNLSWDQKFKLSTFPEKVLSYAFNQIKYGPPFRTSYNWFKYFCEEYCKKYHIKPNLRIYYQLREVFQIEPQKKEELKTMVLVNPRIYYTPKTNTEFYKLKDLNPVCVFIKQYIEMVSHPSSFFVFMSKESCWEIGVAKMVRQAFMGYLSESDLPLKGQYLYPDLVAAKISQLISCPEFKDMQEKFGDETCAKFIELCFEAVENEQSLIVKMIERSIKHSASPYSQDKLLYRTMKLDQFISSADFSYLSNFIGEKNLKQYLYEILNKWMRIIQ